MPSAYRWERSARLILKTPSFAHEALTRMLDRTMIWRNLSPGGCAGLFALSFFINDVPRES
jgi:triphosphoribosyl-dephospho-CoA synthetase